MVIAFKPVSNEWKNDRTAPYLVVQIAESMKKVKRYTQRIKPSIRIVPKTCDDKELSEGAGKTLCGIEVIQYKLARASMWPLQSVANRAL